MSYKIYFQQAEGHFRVLDSQTKQITTHKFQPLNGNSYALFKGYDTSDEGLIHFHDDFKQWCTELRNNNVLSVVYDKYYSHHSAVEMTFKRLCKNKYEHHDPITITEAKWSDMCNNGGLMYCSKGVHDSYGYDAVAFYPSILASQTFRIPTKQGKEMTLIRLLKVLKCGYYRVKITSDNEDFKKVFAYSQHHVYTHISLEHAYKHQKQFNVTIDLITDGKPNAYIYTSVNLIPCSDIFGKWYDVLSNVKKLYPKNKLVKHLLSSVWGHLSRTNKITRTYEQIIEQDLQIGRTEKAPYFIEDHHIFTDKEYYVLVPRDNPYKFNIRLKSFLTSYGRNITANVALLDIDHVIRVQTDGIVFDKPVEMGDTKFIHEEKTTGKIEWSHVNKYIKL